MLTVNQFKRATGVHITVKHTGKMQGIQSLSSSPLQNPSCKARGKVINTICSHCFSQRMLQRYNGLENVLKLNSDILTTKLIPFAELPHIKSPSNCFRFEAFGDLINDIQLINYINIAAANPETNFALWTKRYIIINKVFNSQQVIKPANLQK